MHRSYYEVGESAAILRIHGFGLQLHGSLPNLLRYGLRVYVNGKGPED
jgi:hypothetical protein